MVWLNFQSIFKNECLERCPTQKVHHIMDLEWCTFFVTVYIPWRNIPSCHHISLLRRDIW